MVAKVKRIPEAKLKQALKTLPHWSVVRGKLHRELQFEDFSSAFAFMSMGALISERMDHHPEWSNLGGRVTIDLLTHECGGISQRDIVWALQASKYL